MGPVDSGRKAKRAQINVLIFFIMPIIPIRNNDVNHKNVKKIKVFHI